MDMYYHNVVLYVSEIRHYICSVGCFEYGP